MRVPGYGFAARVAVTLGLVAASGGCVAVESFDPVGSVAAIAASWEIDSTTPSSSACDRLGANRMRITFLDGLRPIAHSALFAQCSAGSLDSREGAGAVVAAGTWTVRLDALDSSGTVVAAGPSMETTVEEDQPDGTPLIEVPAADFFTSTLSTAFRVGGETPDRDRCDAAGIDRVALVFDDLGGGATGSEGVEPCAVGFVGTRVSPGHTYTVRVRALDEDGGTVSETAATTMDVGAGQAVRLDEVEL